MAKNYKTGIIITGDAKGGLKAIAATDKNLGKLGKSSKKTESNLTSLKKTSKATAASIFKISAASGAAATAAGAYAVVNANQIKQNQMLADAVGDSAKKLSGLSYAFKDTQITSEKLGDILKDTSEKIGDYLVTGGGEAADVIEKLNLNVGELANATPSEQLFQIADALDQVGTRSEKIAILESMASDASLLLPMLENNAEGLKKAQQEAEALGVSLDDIDSRMISAAASDIDRLMSGVDGFGNLFAKNFMPIIGGLSGEIVDSITETNWLREATQNMAESAVSGIGFVLDSFQQLQLWAAYGKQGFLGVAVAATGSMASVSESMADVINTVLWPFKEALALVADGFGWILEAVSKLGGPMADSFKAGSDALKNLSDQASDFRVSGNDLIELHAKTLDAALGNLSEIEKLANAEPYSEKLKASVQEMKQHYLELAKAKEEAAKNSGNVPVSIGMNQKDINSFQSDIEKLTLSTDEFGEAWTRTGDKALDALGSMGQVLEKVNGMEASYAEDALKIQQLREKNDQAYSKNTEKWKKNDADLTKKQMELEERRAENYMAGTTSMLDASVALYEEGSEAQRAAHAASLAMHAAEMANGLQEAIMAATVAVANQGKGDPYTAFARVAAMSVMMGGVLSQIGATFGIGGSSGGPDAVSSVDAPDGGVIGGGTSESVSNVLNYMSDIEADQYTELQGIYAEMKSLNSNITGVVSSLYRTGDLSSLSQGAISQYSYGGQGAVDAVSGLDKKINDFLGGPDGVLGALTGIGGAIGGAIGGIVGGAIEGLSTGLFGSTSKSTTDYGLAANNFALGDGVDLKSYQTVRTAKDGGWFRKTKISYNDQYRDVSGETERLLNDVFGNLRDATIEVGDYLDRDVESQVDDFKVSLGKISTAGKTGAEIEKALNDAISRESDKLAYSVFGDLVDQYGKLNEAAFETVSRLVSDKVAVEDTIDLTNQNITGDSIALSQALIEIAGGLNELRGAAENYYDAFFSDAEKQARSQKYMQETLQNLNLTLPETRSGYRALVESLDLSSESAQKQYVTLMKLSGAADEYYQGLEDQFDAYKNNVLQQRIDLLNAESSAIDSTISSLEQLYSSLETAYGSIVGTLVPSSAEYMDAQSVISDALAQAQGGTLPQLSEISGALSIVSRNAESNYATFQDYQRDQLITSNMIGDLMGYTGDQISVEQQMLDSLTLSVQKLNEIADNTSVTSNIELNQLITDAVDGSHATGLSYVPFDGYRAELHKGEAVIDARTMQGLKRYGVSSAGHNDGLIEEVKALRQEIIQIKNDQRSGFYAVAKNTMNSSKTLDRIDLVGVLTRSPV